MAARIRHLRSGYLKFFCPGCKTYHCPTADRWRFNGDVHRPTLDPSVKVTMGPEPGPDGLAPPGAKDRICHSFVRNGQIQFLADCTHALAGQTVDLPDLPADA